MATVGKRLKQIRKELGISQDEFGAKINLSRAGIAAVEADKNKFSQDTLYKLLTTFNVNLNFLIGGFGGMFNSCDKEAIKEEILLEVNKLLKQKGL